MDVDVSKETLGFQSEVRQLLDLVINSLYSNKEVFLRELISNASDALDKLRFEALANDALYEGDSNLEIHVDYSKNLKTITIRDNGIGMSREEVVANLGTIARSGTREFFKALTGDRQKDTQLIGQFGVGFYSAFIVADRVTVTSRRVGLSEDEGVLWESDGKGEFSVQIVRKRSRGTEVVLHLKEDENELLDGFRLRDIIRKYSDHIAWPILMPREGSPGEERANSATALWTRAKKDITEEEYTEFYKHIGHDFEAPLAKVHNRVEGAQEYTTLFFVPAHAPFDLWDRDARHGVKLYVKRVFIMDDAEQLLPRYLRFVRGVVDSNDLPLNVSREILQHNRIIDAIRAASVKRLLGLFEDLGKDSETYAKFWKQFGRVLKEGVVEDVTNQERIARLLRFSSTHTGSEENSVSLDDYIARMQEGQEHIYYLTGDSFATVRRSPHLEVFRQRGVEVLLMSDPIDEWVVTHLTEFGGKKLKSVAKGDLDLGRVRTPVDSPPSHEVGAYKDLLRRLRSILDSSVKDVRLSERLTASPACLVSEEHDLSPHLERILKAAGQEIGATKPILEINPEHPLILRLNDEHDSASFEDWARILFDQALLAEGGKLADPAAFVERLNQMLVKLTGSS